MIKEYIDLSKALWELAQPDIKEELPWAFTWIALWAIVFYLIFSN
jgi:hypothetical protein